jgi:hypothetical protein
MFKYRFSDLDKPMESSKKGSDYNIYMFNSKMASLMERDA